MESTGCYLGLGLILGSAITALLLEGNARRRAALSKMRSPATEKPKADAIMQKARENRRKGCAELPTSLLIMLAGIGLLILAAYLLSTGQGL